MKKITIYLLLSLFIPLAIDADNVDDKVQIAGTNDKCADFCMKTIKNGDAPTKSCQQGCRLYSILQFVDKANGIDASEPNSTALSVSCQSECNEAYKDALLKKACVDGCQHQTPFTTGHIKIVMDDSSPMFPFAQKLMANSFGMMEKMKNWFKDDPLIQSPIGKVDGGDNFMNFFDRVDSKFRNLFNQMIADSKINAANLERRLLEGADELKSKMDTKIINPLFAYAKSLSGNTPTSAPIVQTPRLVDLDPNDLFFGPSKAPISNSDENGEPIIIVKMIKNDGLFDGDETRRSNSDKGWLSFTQQTLNGKPHEPSPPLLRNDETYIDADDTWLACLARRTQSLSVFTRWVLCAALMLSLLCMMYLCLAVMKANQQRRRRLYLQYKMGKTDTAYFTPPPTYEKFNEYSLKNEEEKSESPPPAYEIAVQNGEPVVKDV